MNKPIEEKVDELREQLSDIRSAVDKLTSSAMKEKTILVLLNHYTGLPQKTIKQVLYGIDNLELEYFCEDDE